MPGGATPSPGAGTPSVTVRTDPFRLPAAGTSPIAGEISGAQQAIGGAVNVRAPHLFGTQLQGLAEGQLAQAGQTIGEAQAQRGAAIDASMAARARQDQLAGRLMSTIRGEGPSAAQAQLQMGLDQALRSQAALAASGRGNPALASRTAAGNAAALQGQVGQQAAMLRGQESALAQGQLGQLLAAQRAGDLGLSQQSLGLQGLGLQQQGAGVAGIQGLQAQQLAEIQAQRQLTADIAQGLRGQAIQQDIAQNQMIMAGVGTGAQLTGQAVAAMSDRRAKRDVRPAGEHVGKLLEALRPSCYRYREEVQDMPEAGRGERIGIMAQDLERTELGKALVKRGDDGLRRIDVGATTGLLLAALSDQHRRLKAVEGGKR